MTDAADLVLTDATVHSLTHPDRTAGAIAVRDGRVLRVADPYDVDMLVGAGTRRVALDGRVVLPGFVDAHTHLTFVGRRAVHADLSTATDRDEAVDALDARAGEVAPDDWVLGYGYDESGWPDARYLSRSDLDAVDHPGPVAAFREDLHVVSVDSAALDRVDVDDGDPPGVLVEDAAETVRERLQPDRAEARRLVEAGQRRAVERGVTTIHDLVRRSGAPRAYRDLASAGDLSIRVRLYYWRDHLDAVEELGVAPDGTDRVRVQGIKWFADGSIGARTARLSIPYADGEGRGEWVVAPDEIRALAERVDGLDLQPAVHAIGDAAVDGVVDAYADAVDPDRRPRVEHAELASDRAIDRMAERGIVASVQPNFLKWAGEGGLYADRLGDRRTRADRLRRLLDAGVDIAFGSDCMPLDPLLGVHHAVNAPTEAQRLGVTEAIRAYTLGGARAGFDEDRIGTLERGKSADVVVLDESPWARPHAIRDVDVVMTVVDGEVVYEDEAALA